MLRHSPAAGAVPAGCGPAPGPPLPGLSDRAAHLPRLPSRAEPGDPPDKAAHNPACIAPRARAFLRVPEEPGQVVGRTSRCTGRVHPAARTKHRLTLVFCCPQSAGSPNTAPADDPNPAGEVDMRLAGPLRIVALIVTVGLTWIVVSILLGGPGSGFPRIQQLFSSPENSATAEPRARKYKCGLPQPCPEEHLAFRMVSGAANVIGPKICLEDKMLMSSVKDNVGRGLNIALVNGVSGELIEARAFDMWAGDVNDLLKFIRPLHEGTLVFVASYDDPATKMNEETRKLFSDLGSKNVKDLAFRDSWVFVGAKGVQNKSPFEQHVKNSKHTNKYEGWPEALEMEGCIPRRTTAS
uniref:FAM3 metabolism regulating signaling molecule A n=5 Tax=Felidae TaxID=9681 RepID=A0ABI7VU84_FELCA